MSREEVAQNIAELLGESDERPRTQITGVVAALGEQVALELVAETQRVEEAGGMLVPDGSRRRTPGGVFFVLARRRLSSADRTAIFGQPTARAPKAPKPAGNGGPPVAPPAPPMRRRAVEVVTLTAGQRPRAATSEGGQAPRALAAAPAAVKQGLARAVDRASARRAIATLIEALSPDDQRLVLLDVLAELEGGEGESGAPQRGPFGEKNSGAGEPGAGARQALGERRPLSEPPGRMYGSEPPGRDPNSGRFHEIVPLRQTEPTPPRAWDPTGTPSRIDGTGLPSEPPKNPVFDSAPPSPPRRRIVTPLVPPPSPVPSLAAEDPESGTLRSTVLGAIKKSPGIGLGELAERAYGEDSPINRKRVQTIVSNLKRDGKVRASARGRFEVV